MRSQHERNPLGTDQEKAKGKFGRKFEGLMNEWMHVVPLPRFIGRASGASAALECTAIL